MNSENEKIVKYLTKSEPAMEFLHKNRIAEVKSIIDIKKYNQGRDRQGLILKLIEKEAMVPIDVIVDVKNGQPSVEQVRDTIYNIGSECNKRIIVYTGNSNYFNRDKGWSNISIVENLLNLMNQYPLELYLVKAFDFSDSQISYNFEVINEPTNESIIDKNNIPSETDFLQEEFWQLYYHTLDQDMYGCWVPFSNGFINVKGTGIHADLGNFEVKIKWSNNGLFFYAKENNSAVGELKRMWNDGDSKFKKLFNGCKMCFEDDAQNGSELEIQLWNLPITYLAGASKYEKEYSAKFIRTSFSKFTLFLEYNLIDIY